MSSTQASPLPLSAQIESVRGAIASTSGNAAAEDFRVLAETLVGAIQATNPNALRPQGTAATQAAPQGTAISANGANGAITIAMEDGEQAGRPVWKEISTSPVKGFTSNVTVHPVTTGNSLVLNQPGASHFVRMRTSFDRQNWSGYQMSGQAPVEAGLVSSSAIAAGGAFNQTNYAEVTSTSSGSGDVVSINGAGCTYTPYTAVKGGAQSLRPSATIVGLVQQSKQFVAWDGSQFRLQPSLATTLADNLEPVGVVTVGSPVVGGGTASGGNGGRLTAV